YANNNPKVGMLEGTSSFLVPRETKGLTVARCNETMGCRFMNNGELVFEDMHVPGDHLLVENDALGKAGVYFRPGKIIQASKNLGVGVHAFEAAADYVQNYVQGGRILIKHQAVALRLADMATRIEAVRALLERAAQAVDDNAPDAETLCNMVKLFASEEILKVAQHCLELHGGNGVMLDFGVEKIYRDAAVFLHMDATVDISKMKIVKSMFPETAGKNAGPGRFSHTSRPGIARRETRRDGLMTRASIFFAKSSYKKRWIAGSSPAMTILNRAYSPYERTTGSDPKPIGRTANQNGTTMPSSGASQLSRFTRFEAMKMPPSACTR